MPDPNAASAAASARLSRWQTITLVSLFTGYAGYYICRSNLSVATPLLLEDYGAGGLTKANIGDIASVGVFLYAMGKLVNGLLTEWVGAKRMFLGGMALSVGCTLTFTLPGIAGVYWPMLFVWAVNRFVQSMGWGGLVLIAGRWFPANRYAAMMGILSMSYLVGDALARFILGGVVKLGANWQQMFWIASAVLGAIAILCLFLTHVGPSRLNLPEPNQHLHNDETTRRDTVLALLRNPIFWIVCIMNIGLTTIRETFNLWTPTYLTEEVKLSPGVAGMTSLIFPLAGAAASLVAGWIVDCLQNRYSLVLIPSLVILVGILVVMARLPIGDISEQHRAWVMLTLIGTVAFFLAGPYTFCSGALAMSLGGVRGAAAAAGIIDTAGYLGAIAAGSVIGRVATSYGWNTAFLTLGGLALWTAAIAIWYAFATSKPSSAATP